MSNSELMTHRLDILSVPSSSIVLFFLSRSILFFRLDASGAVQLQEASLTQAAVRAWLDARVAGRGGPITIGPRGAMIVALRVGELHVVRP